MDDYAPPAKFTLRATGTVAAVVVVVAMALLYWHFSGSSAPDWDGYARLYDDEGGWLLKQGRDPGFIWFIQDARHLFGPNGYGAFRASLFVGFAAFAAWLVYAMPMQQRLGALSAWLTALIVLTSFLLKSLVEIREGIAFLFILVPVVALYGRSKHDVLGSGVGAVVAALVHAGTVLFSGNWLAALGLSVLPDATLAGRSIQRWLLVVALLIGGALAFSVFQNADAVEFLLQDFGVDRSAEAQGGLWKYLYWTLNGTLVLIVRHQVLAAIKGVTKFAYAYASALASIAMPLVYALCVTLVFSNFRIPAATSMVIRVLFTSMELCLVIVTCRGRGNLATGAVAAVMLVDRSRLLFLLT